jgi:hypothetical protein
LISVLNTTLNPPSLAETVNAKGFSHAAGFRIVAIEPGRAEIALTRRATVEVFTGDATSERLCAFATATMRALDLPAGFR